MLTPHPAITTKWLCLSRPLHGHMTVYKNLDEKRPRLEKTRDFETSNMQETTLHLPLHTGTHIDYPRHALAWGKLSDAYQRFPAIIAALVVDLSDNPPPFITLEHVRQLSPLGGLHGEVVTAVFFKTTVDPHQRFETDFPGLSAEAARFLSELPLHYIGTDQLGIERGQPLHETHTVLLEKDILIIEGLDLSMVSGGRHRCLLMTPRILAVEAEPLLVYKID